MSWWGCSTAPAPKGQTCHTDGVRKILWRFSGHVVRLYITFILVTLAVFRVFYSSLQPKSPWLSLIGETATPDQMAIVHRQIDPGPHSFWPRYVHWATGLYFPYVIVAVLVLALMATVSRGYRRTPHDTDPKASAAILIGGCWA